VEHIQQQLREHFKCKFNAPKDFLGLDVTIVEEGKLTLSMSTFTKRMTTTLNVQRWKGDIATPGRTDMKILKSDDTTTDESYRSKVGSLNWLTMGLRYDLGPFCVKSSTQPGQAPQELILNQLKILRKKML
jgi:hypothetical protein